jgi:pimeloyl-ACP methyl ester carboxylesterase
VTPGKRRVRVSGGDLSVVDAGDPEAPAVLFVHGFPTSSFLWRAFVPSLPPAMRAIAPDLLGAGDSDKPVDSPLGIEAQAGYLSELLDALGVDRAAVVGHGHGGGVAELLALRGRAGALVLMDSILFGAPAPAFGPLLGRAAASDAHAYDVIRSAFDAGVVRRDGLPDDALAEYVRPFADDGGRALGRLAAALDDDGPAVRDSELGAVDVPVFVVWGEDDPLTPAESAEGLNDLVPRSTLALLPGCGHFLPEEAPRTVSPLVYEYLRGVYAGLPHAHETGPATIELGRRYRDAKE